MHGVSYKNAKKRYKHECLRTTIKMNFFAFHSIDFMTLFSELSFDPNQMAAAFQEIFESLLNSHAKRTIGICPEDKPFDKRTHAQASSNKNIWYK